MKFLVVAAFDPELLRFRELATEELAVETIGVGLVDAAAGMTRCVTRHAPTHAVLLGTCGGLRVATGEVVCAARARLVVDAGAELPPPMLRVAEVDLDRALHDAFAAAGAKSVQIANTVGVTIDDAVAARLAAESDVEHLEAYAVARVCAQAGVAAGAVLGVANAVGSRGREEWRANHVEAAARAAELAFRAIAAFRTSTRAPSPGRS